MMKSRFNFRRVILCLSLTLITTFAQARHQTVASNNGISGTGGLDLDFGVAGKVITDFGFDRDAQALALAIQSDGRVVAAGRASIPLNGFDFAIARYNRDGTLDAGFGIGGRVTTDFFGSNDGATGVIIQTDGRIVVGGDAFNTSTGNTDFAIARYNPDGSPDTSFDADGKLTADISVNDVANTIILQRDGRLVLAGSALDGQLSKDFVLLRYNSNGTPDASFGTNGRVITDFSNQSDEIVAVLVKPDGRILAAGFAGSTLTGRDFAVAQYNSDGSLDSTFGVGGKATVDFFGSTDEARAVALQTDGRVVVAGSAFDGDTLADFALARFNDDGTLDSSFRGNGKVTTNFFGNQDVAETLIVLSDGRILAAGRAFLNGSNSDFALVSYKHNGKPDASLGPGGKLTTDFFGRLDQGFDMTVDSDGGVLIAGSAAGVDLRLDFAMARYLVQTNSQRAQERDNP